MVQYRKSVYQWLLRQNGYNVSNTGYFVYANGITGDRHFDGKLEFEMTLIAYKGNDAWVEKTLARTKECLDSDSVPNSAPSCDFCQYHTALRKIEDTQPTQ